MRQLHQLARGGVGIGELPGSTNISLPAFKRGVSRRLDRPMISVRPSCQFHTNSCTTYMRIEVTAVSAAVCPAVAMCPVVQKEIAKISVVPISRHVRAFVIALRMEMLS